MGVGFVMIGFGVGLCYFDCGCCLLILRLRVGFGFAWYCLIAFAGLLVVLVILIWYLILC